MGRLDMADLQREIQWLLNEKYQGKCTKKAQTEIKKLKKGEPIDYLIGWVDFLGAKIDLSKRPFIPREETAFWVQKCIEEMNPVRKDGALNPVRCLLSNGVNPTALSKKESGLYSSPSPGPSNGVKRDSISKNVQLKILDLFAGSGCIGIAILKNCPDLNLRVDFGEINDKFWEQIKINLELNKISPRRYRIIKTDVFQNIKGEGHQTQPEQALDTKYELTNYQRIRMGAPHKSLRDYTGQAFAYPERSPTFVGAPSLKLWSVSDRSRLWSAKAKGRSEVALFTCNKSRTFARGGVLNLHPHTKIWCGGNTAARIRYFTQPQQAAGYSKVRDKYDYILANPPYGALSKIHLFQSSVLKSEPRKAIFAKSDGLFYIKKIIREAKNHLKPRGRLYLEFSPEQKNKIKKWLEKSRFSKVQFFQDQFSRWRYLKIEYDQFPD